MAKESEKFLLNFKVLALVTYKINMPLVADVESDFIIGNAKADVDIDIYTSLKSYQVSFYDK